MARQEFIDQLKTLRYQLQDKGEGRIAIEYDIPVGKFIGQKIQLGLVVGDDFPLNPPGGIHVSPYLLPINTASKNHPEGGIHKDSPFGAGWQYWSRPFPDWPNTDRTVRTYMAHVRHLFETQ